MPTVHCIKRKWLEQRKLQACLHQAERMRLKAAADKNDDKNDTDDGAVTVLTSQSAPLPIDHDPVPCHDSPDRLLSLSEADERHDAAAASVKKRRPPPQCQDTAVVTPNQINTPTEDDDDEDSVISDTPAHHSRKRKMRSCQQSSDDRLVAISNAIRDGIVPRDNDL